jgi:arginine:pyruvate transaminase
VVACASISKSHAAAGFRSGWCAGPAEFCARLLPLAETMLFGNQPFIADMTAAALGRPDLVAGPMRARLAGRAHRLAAALDGVEGLRTNRPEAGMFVLLDVSATGLDGAGFAEALLAVERVAVMPGASFGAALGSWVRIGLTATDAEIDEAARRIRRFAARARAD